MQSLSLTWFIVEASCSYYCMSLLGLCHVVLTKAMIFLSPNTQYCQSWPRYVWLNNNCCDFCVSSSQKMRLLLLKLNFHTHFLVSPYMYYYENY